MAAAQCSVVWCLGQGNEELGIGMGAREDDRGAAPFICR
jgi:hypothetical protein